MKRILVVNGASSTGCSSLVRHAVALAGEGAKGYHLDDFAKQLPGDVWARCSGSVAGWEEIARMFSLHLFEQCLEDGTILADCLIRTANGRDYLFDLFGRENVFLVKLSCELDELERRELRRGDRKLGLARSQFEAVDALTDHDLEIDTTRTNIEGCSWILQQALAQFSRT